MIARIQELRLEKCRRIIAVSDVHGNLPYLKGLLNKIKFSPDDILFIVGDLLEKGPYSLDTLHYVMELDKTHEIHLISGNCDWWYPILHDPVLMKSCPWYLNNKPCNLAKQMCEKIGYTITMDVDVPHMRETLKAAFPEEFEFLRKMPEVIRTEHYTFVHGGLPEGDESTWDAWQCMKFDRYMERSGPHKKWLICGHWPVVLYGDDKVCADPIINREKHIISIDGGCVLKDDGQLNALIIPGNGSEDFTYEYYDHFPTATVLDAQKESERSWYIRWGDNKVEILRYGEEFCRCRHERSGYEMDILTKYISERPEGLFVNDCSDYQLPLSPGDTVSIVEETSRGYYVKHRGVSGWYRGRLR